MPEEPGANGELWIRFPRRVTCHTVTVSSNISHPSKCHHFSGWLSGGLATGYVKKTLPLRQRVSGRAPVKAGWRTTLLDKLCDNGVLYGIVEKSMGKELERSLEPSNKQMAAAQ